MSRNILSNAVIAGAMVLAMGCATKKTMVKPPVAVSATVSNNKEEVLKQIIAKDLSFNTLAIKGKSTINVNGAQNDATLNIRIKKDQTIWVSLTALGGVFEAARALITPDSILLMNRLERTVTRKPFNFIHGFTNTQVDFQLLQALLVGNAIKSFVNPEAQAQQEEDLWKIKGNRGELAYSAWFSTLFKPSEVSLFDATTLQSLKAAYNDYKDIGGGQLFPSVLDLTSRAGQKNFAAAISFNKVELNMPVEFPFTAPKSFRLIK